MCGIAAVMDLKHSPVAGLETALRVMNDLQKHRGPDGAGLWQHSRGHVGLAHRRLSIIDLGAGQQPMTDSQGNWLVFNGEIYNYIELRQELGEDLFRTTSDTEVILRAYRRWGARLRRRNCAACLPSLYGTRADRRFSVPAIASASSRFITRRSTAGSTWLPRPRH